MCRRTLISVAIIVAAGMTASGACANEVCRAITELMPIVQSDVRRLADGPPEYCDDVGDCDYAAAYRMSDGDCAVLDWPDYGEVSYQCEWRYPPAQREAAIRAHNILVAAVASCDGLIQIHRADAPGWAYVEFRVAGFLDGRVDVDFVTDRDNGSHTVTIELTHGLD